MPPVGNTVDKVTSIVSEFNTANTVKAYKRARLRACRLPVPDQLTVLPSLAAAHRRIA